MWRWLRRSFLVGMVLLPFVMWGGLRAAGVSLKVSVLPWDFPLGGILVPVWVGWEASALAAFMEMGSRPVPPQVPVGQEVGQWLLYSILGAFLGGLFALWTALTVETAKLVVRLFPFLKEMEGCLAGMSGVAWLAWLLWLVVEVAELGWAEIFRRTLRYRVLRLHTSDSEILGLLEKVPLSPPLKRRYAERIQREGVNLTLAEELLEALSKVQVGERFWEDVNTLTLKQALRNRIEEESEA